MSTYLHHSEHVNITDNSRPVLSDEAKLTLYSIVKIPFLNIWWGGGVNILYHNILTHPPHPNLIWAINIDIVSSKIDKCSTWLVTITDNSSPWLTFLTVWGEGVRILWYTILTPPPTNIQEWYLEMEFSDNLASSYKTFTHHRQYYVEFVDKNKTTGAINL